MAVKVLKDYYKTFVEETNNPEQKEYYTKEIEEMEASMARDHAQAVALIKKHLKPDGTVNARDLAFDIWTGIESKIIVGEYIKYLTKESYPEDKKESLAKQYTKQLIEGEITYKVKDEETNQEIETNYREEFNKEYAKGKYDELLGLPILSDQDATELGLEICPPYELVELPETELQ